MCPCFRYQPEGVAERQPAFGEKVFLTSGVGESDLTESESHLNMLKGGSSTLQVALRPPCSPSKHSSRLVNISICVLGKEPGMRSGRLTRTLSEGDVCLLVSLWWPQSQWFAWSATSPPTTSTPSWAWRFGSWPRSPCLYWFSAAAFCWSAGNLRPARRSHLWWEDTQNQAWSQCCCSPTDG